MNTRPPVAQIVRHDLLDALPLGPGTSAKDYSQFGEQGVIEYVLSDIKQGYAVEVGAVDGIYMSTSKALEELGWNCLCIEPNPFYWAPLLTNRKLAMPYALSEKNAELVPFHCYDRGNGDFTAGSGFSTDVQKLISIGMPPPAHTYTFKLPVRTLDYCLAAADFPRVDFVSIDAEGADLDILRGFNIRVWKPKLVMVETWDDFKLFDAFFEPLGYARVARIAVNDLFMPVN